MSFRSIYKDCIRSNISALVIKKDGRDTLLGYRAFLYKTEENKRYVYDFAVSPDLFSEPSAKDLYDFLTAITKTSTRLQLFTNGKGKLVTQQELDANYTITELSSKPRILNMLESMREIYIVAGRYSKKGV